MHGSHPFNPLVLISIFPILTQSILIFPILTDYGLNTSQIVVNVIAKCLIDFPEDHKLLIIVLCALVLLLMQFEKVAFYVPHSENWLLTGLVAEVDALEEFVKSNEVLVFIDLVKRRIFGETWLNVLIALPIIDGEYLFYFSLNLFGVW